MDERIHELLGRITELSDEELNELRDLILGMVEGGGATPDDPTLAALAASATVVQAEWSRRQARGRRPAQTATATVPEDRRPRYYTRNVGTVRAVTASGMDLPNGAALTREFCDVLNSSSMSMRDGDRRKVATIRAERPDGRTLHTSDAPEAITAAFTRAATEHVSAITAAGGFVAPEESVYDLPGFETVDRPVKAALPGHTTERGGVRFMKPPTLESVNPAIGIWDEQMDIAAVTNPAVRKPSHRVTPLSEIVVNVQAVTNLLIFGNMAARAYPEWVQRCIDLSLATQARVAEQQLLTQIGALSTQASGASSEASGLGATRVLLPLLERAATGMRHRLRTAPDASLTLILPHWARGLLRSDLARQEPGDATLGVDDAELTRYLTERHFLPVWAMDGEAGQNFSAQNPGPVNAWPNEVISYLFPSGAWQFLDGGTLDLGIVRDSTTNAANDYLTFVETFETVAFRGGESLRIKQALTPSGVARAAAA